MNCGQVAILAWLCATGFVKSTTMSAFVGATKPGESETIGAMQQRLADLEILVRRQQALIDELLKGKDGGGTKAEDILDLKNRIHELESRGNEGKSPEIASLAHQLQELKISLLKSQPEPARADSKGAATETPEAPPEPNVTTQPTIPTTGSEKQLPDISIITNGRGLFSDDRTDPDRNRFLIDEVELGFQGYLYPSIRADAFVAVEREPGATGLNAVLEEAYATFLHTPIKGLALKAGKKHLEFGRVNRIHQEKLPYQDRPAPLRNFLGPENLNGHGAQLEYLIPTPRGLFAQVQLGYWRPGEPELDPATGLEAGNTGSRIADRLILGRLWASKAFKDDSELELGLSSAFGRSLLNGSGTGVQDPIRIHGVDVTFRKYPGAHKRILLQAEYLQHQRSLAGFGTDRRQGYYVLGAYAPSKYYEMGLRYDSSGVPAPSVGHESGIVGFLTHRLTETTYLRYQLKHATHPAGGSFNQFAIQFVWGIGPHAHALE